MNKKNIIILLLVSILLMAELEAWRVRRIRVRRIRVRRIISGGCKKLCYRACPELLRKKCKEKCKKVCGRKKRMALDPDEHLTQLPANIDFYDRNENNVLEIEEFAVALAQNVTEPGLLEAFYMADTNKDNVLSEEEFLIAVREEAVSDDGDETNTTTQ